MTCLLCPSRFLHAHQRYDIYIWHIRYRSCSQSKRSKTPLRSRETGVLGFRRKQHPYSNIILFYSYCRVLYIVTIHSCTYGILCIPAHSLLIPVLNCMPEFFGVAGTALKNRCFPQPQRIHSVFWDTHNQNKFRRHLITDVGTWFQIWVQA